MRKGLKFSGKGSIGETETQPASVANCPAQLRRCVLGGKSIAQPCDPTNKLAAKGPASTADSTISKELPERPVSLLNFN